jgi:uncharacterized protein YlxP (DUF503 family)
LPETNLGQAKVVAERIQKTWEQTPSNMDGEMIRSTVSIGGAEASHDDKSFEDVLRRADRLLDFIGNKVLDHSFSGFILWSTRRLCKLQAITLTKSEKPAFVFRNTSFTHRER